MQSLSDFFLAMEKGAAHIYHDLMVIEDDVTKWTQDNPAIAALLNTGVQMGTNYLAAHGVPLPMIEIAGQAIVGSLRQMAATDNSNVTTNATDVAKITGDMKNAIENHK